jgi:high-affinity nickel permease
VFVSENVFLSLSFNADETEQLGTISEIISINLDINMLTMCPMLNSQVSREVYTMQKRSCKMLIRLKLNFHRDTNVFKPVMLVNLLAHLFKYVEKSFSLNCHKYCAYY